MIEEDLERYQGEDERAEYICSQCGGAMYCIEETKIGDAVYQCQSCFIEATIVFQ